MNTHSNNSSSIEVYNFGPISEAKVDLRPLTVLVGPNNTGKSYFATVLYALQRAIKYTFNDINPTTHGVSVLEFDILMRDTAERLHSQLTQKDPKQLEFGDNFHEYLSCVYNQKQSTLIHELEQCFGVVDVNSLSQKNQNNPTKIKIKIKPSEKYGKNLEILSIELSTDPHYNFTIPPFFPLPKDHSKVQTLIRLANNLKKRNPETPRSSEIDLKYEIYEYFQTLFDSLILPFERTFIPFAFYLPASRTTLMEIYNNFRSPNIHISTKTRTSVHPTMDETRADFQRYLLEIDPNQPRNRDRNGDLSKGIEKEILRGSINVKLDEKNNKPSFFYQSIGSKEELPLANTSSMVCELAPIVLFLRYKIKPGRLLIIEEPESHLHPDLQVKLTNQLAILVNAGISVVVTTHSRWLVEALANIVYRSEIPKDSSEKVTNGKINLKHDQVGVWLFQDNEERHGTVVEEIKLDRSIYGQYPTNFDRVAIDLHNEWAGILERKNF